MSDRRAASLNCNEAGGQCMNVQPVLKVNCGLGFCVALFIVLL